MPIGGFVSQPNANSIAAAYRPVIIRVAATRTDGNAVPPVVYCDIYFNDVFYKTISKSQYSSINGEINTQWEFDIQDAAQEYLKKFLGAYGESAIVEATTIITKAICKFRSSGYDVNGFIQHEDDAPVQGTGNTDPVDGTGTSSNEFYIVNAALQHQDNQSLSQHLFYFKKRTWSADALPLTHRPDGYKLGPNDSDVFPIIYSGAQQFRKLKLNYRLCGQNNFNSLEVNVGGSPGCTAIISEPVVEQNITGWLVSWNVVSGAPAKYFVSTPAVNGGIPSETAVTSFQYLFAQLPVGDHVITVRPLCLIEGDYYLGASKTVTITVAVCTPVGILGDANLPNGTEGVIYNYEIDLTGSAPFVLENIVKPGWMDITLTGSVITLSGMPNDPGEDIAVSFDVYNCGGGNSVHFEDTFDVAEMPGGCVPTEADPNFPGAEAGEAYSYSFNLIGSPPFYLDAATVKPDWMTITVVGANVHLSGLPGPGDVSPEVEISIAIRHCVDVVDVFAGSIAVLP